MLLLGFLAFLQTVLLPGYVFVNIFKVKTESNIQKWIYIFAFSLFSNDAIVTILTLLGLYKASLMFVIISLECLYIVYIIYSRRIRINFNFSIRNSITRYLTFFNSQLGWDKILIGTASIVTLFYFSLIISNIGTIFYFVDTVYHAHHWNTWAIDFSNNIFPIESSHFPQLIPTNWSISYLLIGEPNVHFFPKSIMPLFFFGNILMFLDLAITSRKKVFFLGLIIYGLFAPVIYNLVFIADGNGDLPVSFFAFLAFYSYLKADKTKYNLKKYLIIFLFASTAAGTKLAGFYVFFFLSILCLYYLIKNFRLLSKKEIIVLIITVIIVLAINLFWYFVKPQVMAAGLDQPEWLAEGYINILKNALHKLYYNFGLPILAFLIITIFFSLFTREARYITLVFVIPPVILWMFKYSADFRNLSFAVPFISYVSAFGAEKIYKIIKNKIDNLVFNRTQEINRITEKRILSLAVLFTIVSFVFYFVTISNPFYQVLYWIYSSINKYYFQSNRIIYFTDFTFFVNVDFYHRTISAIFLLLSAAGLFFLTKIKVRDVLLLVIFGIIVLNFTLFTKENILNCQKNQFDKVDARNYYQTLNTIVKSGGYDSTIFTNFKSILTERIPRDINFIYLSEKEIEKLLNQKATTHQTVLFIKKDNSNKDLSKAISNNLINNKSEILLEDNDYIFLTLNKNEQES